MDLTFNTAMLVLFSWILFSRKLSKSLLLYRPVHWGVWVALAVWEILLIGSYAMPLMMSGKRFDYL